jgi:opine dehydrogenase
MDQFPVITVCGCGAGAMATAADLSFKGFQVNLFEVAGLKANLDPIHENGGISLTGNASSGKVGLARLNKVTHDPGEAIKGSRLILINVPAMAVGSFVEALAPYFEAGQTVVVTTGYWASLRFREVLRETGADQKINFAEFSIMPYLCDKTGPAQVHVGNYKRDLVMSAWPATRQQAAYQAVRIAYPQVRLCKHILELNLQPGNPGVHAQITIPNAAFFFERARVFRFYGEVSYCASRLTDAHDKERMSIAAAYGCNTITWPDYCRRVYEYKGQNLYELCANFSDPHQQRWSSIEEAERLLVEDLCYSFIPMEELGKVVGIPAPVTTAMIEILAAFTGFDYRASGITLKDLGLDGLSKQQIIDFVTYGVPTD